MLLRRGGNRKKAFLPFPSRKQILGISIPRIMCLYELACTWGDYSSLAQKQKAEIFDPSSFKASSLSVSSLFVQALDAAAWQ